MAYNAIWSMCYYGSRREAWDVWMNLSAKKTHMRILAGF